MQWNKNSCVVTCKATGQVTITHKYGSKAGRQNSSETFIVTITDGEITELTKTFSDVTVKVNKIAGTNKLLNGKELVVEKLESGSDYDTYVDLLGDDTVLGIYDIYLKDTETGERSELPSGAKLKVTITADYLENGEEVNVGHYKNPTTPLGVTNDSDVAVDKVTVSVHSISFFITSFSTFTISSEGSGDSGGGGTVVPTQQGSILDGRTFDDANDWQIVSGKYTDNAPTNKTDSRDGNVRVQKNVIPTGTENEFYVYLSIDTKVTNEVITTFLKEKLTVSNYLFGSASHFPGGGSEHDGGKLYRGNSWNDLVQGTGKNAGDHRVTFRIYSPQPEHEYLGTVTLGCEDSNFQVYLKLSDNDNGQVVALGLGCAKNGELQGSADITLTDEAYQYLIQESAKTTSVTDMSVDDQMGDYIEFLEVVAGDYSTDPAVGPNNTLNWKVVPKSNPEPQKVSNTEFWQLNVAELLYKVRLDVTKADFNSCANKMNSSTSDDESYKVNNYATLKYNGSSEATFPVPYVRGLLYDLQFTKVAEVNGVEKTVTDVPALKNAVFKITDGTTTKTASPDDNGVVKFTGLPWGNYTVSETTVPSGYTKGNDFSANLCYTTNASNLTASALDNTHETLTSYSNAADNKVVNKKKKTTSIIVKKVGANSAVLAGAKFKLFRVDGTDVIVGEEFTVPKAGWTINGLTSGSYKLQETSAPDGYIIVSDPIEFTVNATGTGAVIQWPEGTGKPASVQELSGTDNDTITVINTPGQALPNTGGHGTLLYTLSGLMLIITSAIMFGFRRRLREGKCR
ncbi:MAG: SpaA isopeptide-forming pilin-related protein [Lachnospiraceae bacterium]|nr:SpaA isopeptide-forming pilin-related protein [Lachnospiraceae bacterium]